MRHTVNDSGGGIRSDSEMTVFILELQCKNTERTGCSKWYIFLNCTLSLFFQFVLTEMYYDGFHRSFCDDDDDLDIIQESDSIFAFETPETFKLENIRTKRGKTFFISCKYSPFSN